jgi:hypothetical protein
VVPEPEGSSPQSHHPANGPYPEPAESTPPPPPPANLPKVSSDPVIPSSPWSSKWSFSLGLSHQNPVHVSALSRACHMPCPPHSPWFDLICLIASLPMIKVGSFRHCIVVGTYVKLHLNVNTVTCCEFAVTVWNIAVCFFISTSTFEPSILSFIYPTAHVTEDSWKGTANILEQFKFIYLFIVYLTSVVQTVMM